MTPHEDDIIEPIASEEEDQEVGVPVYRIRSYPSDPDLETLHGRWNRGELVIPMFQRGFVWKPSQASRLIESFLMGLPVPGIFVFVRETDGDESTSEQLVIDGQQRLRSVFGFFDGKLPDGKDFALTGVAPRWEGKTFKTLDPSEQGDLRRAVLRVVNIEQRGAKARRIQRLPGIRTAEHWWNDSHAPRDTEQFLSWTLQRHVGGYEPKR